MKDLQDLVSILHEQIKERSSQHAAIELTIRELPIATVNETFAALPARQIHSFVGNRLEKINNSFNGITIRLESVYF
jgi:hypothetical protein